MSTSNFIVAFELGSHQLTAIVGRKEPDGAINVIAAEQEPSSQFIQRGRIYKPDKMAQCVHLMIERLEKKTKKTILQTYVGIGGMGMHSVSNNVSRVYTEGTKMTQDIVDSMLDENRRLQVHGYDIVDVVPQEYRVGTQMQIDPVGIVAKRIEGTYVDIITASNVRELVESSFHAAKVGIADLIITPEVLSQAILTDAEKRSGCVFIDMGAETTTLAMYNNNLLRYLSVLPIGGANVTRDLMSVLAIEESEAEELKRQYGTAYTSLEDTEVQRDDIRLRDGRVITHNEVVDIIEARMDEILQNVAHQIELAKMDQIIGGLIVTGGAARMRNTDKGLANATGVSKMRFVQHLNMAVRNPKQPDFNDSGIYNAVTAIVTAAEDECCGDARRSNDIFEEQQGPSEAELAAQQAREDVFNKCNEVENICEKVFSHSDNKKFGAAKEALTDARDSYAEVTELAAQMEGDTEVSAALKQAEKSIKDAAEHLRQSRGPSLGQRLRGWGASLGKLATAVVTDEEDEDE